MNDASDETQSKFSTPTVFHVMGEGWYGETALGVTIGPCHTREDLLERLGKLENGKAANAGPVSREPGRRS